MRFSLTQTACKEKVHPALTGAQDTEKTFWMQPDGIRPSYLLQYKWSQRTVPSTSLSSRESNQVKRHVEQEL